MSTIKVLGCIACLSRDWPDVQCEVHHVVEGYRLGHGATMGLCLWHHRGEVDPDVGYSAKQVLAMLGPSLAHNSRAFAEEFGDQATLVLAQTWLIEQYEATPWLDFAIPRGVISGFKRYLAELRLNDATP